MNTKHDYLDLAFNERAEALSRAYPKLDNLPGKENCFDWSSGFHQVKTQIGLVIEVLQKTKIDKILSANRILVMFNPEFVLALVLLFKVDIEKIVFLCDSAIEENKEKLVKIGGKTPTIVRVSSEQVQNRNMVKKFTKELKKHFSFDVVVGNPPYQAPHKAAWVSFTELGLELLTDNGHLGMITPTNWVWSYHTSHKLIFKNEVLALHNDVKNHHILGDCFNGISESIGYFVIKKAKRQNASTTMMGVDGVEHKWRPGQLMLVRKLDVVVAEILDSLNRLEKHKPSNGGIHPSNFVHSAVDIDHPYSVFDNWSDEDPRSTAKVPPDLGMPRVLVSRVLIRKKGHSGALSFADVEGKCHVHDGFYFLTEDEKEAKSLKWLISDSHLMRWVSGYTDKSQYLSPELRANIPKINSNIHSDQALYEYLGLSSKAIERIEGEFNVHHR